MLKSVNVDIGGLHNQQFGDYFNFTKQINLQEKFCTQTLCTGKASTAVKITFLEKNEGRDCGS